MRILLVSSSARGHAIADALKQSPKNPELISIATMANPGIKNLSEEQFVEPRLADFDRILEIVKKTKPDLAVIGPEDPICAGIADVLEHNGVPTVAPSKSLARIESSKAFTRELLKKYEIDASPKFRVFSKENREDLNIFIEQECWGEYVVKFDGLKGGKGVKVSGEHLETIADGVKYAESCIEDIGQVVVEEKLIGCEFSLMSFVSGLSVVDCPLVQDHKRAYDGDTGPNTGGMGTYSDADHSLPFLTKEDVGRAKEIQRFTVEALAKEFNPHPSPLPSKGEGTYQGILYGGYMATRDGVKLIEFNCRFGDPEALNILPILSSDFVAICQAIISGELTEEMVTFEKKATVCKYVVPKSYPEGKEEVGKEIRVPDSRFQSPDSKIYFGDVSREEDGTLRLGGSRAAGIVGIGDTITDAEGIAQKLCKQVCGPVRFRSDIGTDALIQKRVDLMKRLRSS